MVATLAAQLAPLIGLDEQTVSEQILPHLESIKSQNEIKNYLQTLLAPGTKSQSFIQQYLSHRFSPPSQPPPSLQTKGWATPTSSNSRAPSQVRGTRGEGIYEREKRKEALEAAFEGAGGSVYRKGQGDHLEGWGGGTSSKSAAGSRATSSSRAPPTATSNSNSITQSKSAAKGKPKQSTPSTVTLPSSSSSSSAQGLELSESATLELIELDRALKSFQPLPLNKSPRVCFCAARQHPLSLYTPLCKSCGLILCTLNSPSQNRCPSCSSTPLIPPKLVESFIADLTSRRSTLLSNARIQSEQKKEREEQERKAVRFPELGADYRPQPSGMGGGYAGHAGGGMGLQERISRAYETGVSLNGRSLDKKVESGGKVLRLDGKGKVRVQVKKKSVESKKERRKEEGVVEVEETELEDLEEEDGMVAWIDPNDDGISSNLSTSNSNSSGKGERVFRNTSREEEELKWVEREELSHSLLDQDGEERVESVPDSTRVERMRRVVGAGEVVEGTGKGGKGAKK